jgi:hypothetical protein
VSRSDNGNKERNKLTDQAISVFHYFDLILHQVKSDARESFSHALFIFKKLSENLPINEEESLDSNPLTEDIKFCRARLSELIILLQFEDMLEQKFDHISIINNIVIDELKTNNKLSQESKSLLLKKSALLNSAQLERIKQEYNSVCKDLKYKLGEIHSTAENILRNVQGLQKESSHLVNISMIKIHSVLKLIKSFLSFDVLKFSLKIDALIKIYYELDVNIFSSIQEKLEEFDLGRLLKVYTMESERLVFVEVLGGKIEYERMTAPKNENTIDLF